MPSFAHARDTTIFFAGYDLGQYLREFSWVNEIDTPEATPFGSTTRKYVAGMVNGTATGSGFYAGGTDEADEFLHGRLAGATPNWLLYGPVGYTVGSRGKAMQVHQSNFGVSGSVSDVVAIAADFQGSTFVYASGTIFADPKVNKVGAGNHVWTYDRGAGATTSGDARAWAQGLNTSDQTLSLILAHSTDNSSWTSLVTSPVAAGEPWSIAYAGATLNRYVRLTLDATSATNAPTFNVMGVAQVK